MQDHALGEVGDWVTQAGLNGTSEHALLAGVCQKLRAAGLPLTRVNMIMDTLHPLHEARTILWYADGRRDGGLTEVGHVEGRERHAGSWLRSPYYHLHLSGERMLRRRLAEGEPDDFAILADLRQEGLTDYLVNVQHFTPEGSIGEMDSVNLSWATDIREGFSDADVAALSELAPSLALALKSSALQRIVGTLMEVYLGRDAGRLVLKGRIERGVADRVRAVIWFSDLSGFTRITDRARPEHIIPFLNDYAEVVISSIHEAGGDVLKLIGDGTLAIFTGRDDGEACSEALAALAAMHRRVAELNRARQAAGLFTTDAYVGLHLGDVFHGNIGSSDRLDFTVIGPAVNMASRIAAMCRSAERDVLMSADFVEGLAEKMAEAAEVVSVGRYALRGFERPQELFTLPATQRVAGSPA